MGPVPGFPARGLTTTAGDMTDPMTITAPIEPEGQVLPAPEPSRARHGNALRAGVLGSTDGLVSNLSLVAGVAGAGAPHQAIVVAGLAGLVAGSLSMALGEYLSVQNARELLANELVIEAAQLAASPDSEVVELRAIYERKGIPAPMAAELAEQWSGATRNWRSTRWPGRSWGSIPMNLVVRPGSPR